MTQSELIHHLAEAVQCFHLDHPIRVGIDGVDASGKTTLANALADYLQLQKVNIIRASIDGFHNSKAIRYQQGRNSPKGYYMDTTNYAAVIKSVLEPLGPNGNLQYRAKVFDFVHDCPIDAALEQAQPESVLIMEGVFLFRPELVNYWDLKIFVKADFDVTLARAIKRDGYYLDSENEIRAKYEQRYIPGQQLYLNEVHPQIIADIVINNNDWGNPEILVKH